MRFLPHGRRSREGQTPVHSAPEQQERVPAQGEESPSPRPGRRPKGPQCSFPLHRRMQPGFPSPVGGVVNSSTPDSAPAGSVTAATGPAVASGDVGRQPGAAPPRGEGPPDPGSGGAWERAEPGGSGSASLPEVSTSAASAGAGGSSASPPDDVAVARCCAGSWGSIAAWVAVAAATSSGSRLQAGRSAAEGAPLFGLLGGVASASGGGVMVGGWTVRRDLSQQATVSTCAWREESAREM